VASFVERGGQAQSPDSSTELQARVTAHVIQAVNTSLAIYDKVTGQAVAGPMKFMGVRGMHRERRLALVSPGAGPGHRLSGRRLVGVDDGVLVHLGNPGDEGDRSCGDQDRGDLGQVHRGPRGWCGARHRCSPAGRHT
jgi:hypothetical protein